MRWIFQLGIVILLLASAEDRAWSNLGAGNLLGGKEPGKAGKEDLAYTV